MFYRFFCDAKYLFVILLFLFIVSITYIVTDAVAAPYTRINQKKTFFSHKESEYVSLFDMIVKITDNQGNFNKKNWREAAKESHTDRGGTNDSSHVFNTASEIVKNQDKKAAVIRIHNINNQFPNDQTKATFAHAAEDYGTIVNAPAGNVNGQNQPSTQRTNTKREQKESDDDEDYVKKADPIIIPPVKEFWEGEIQTPKTALVKLREINNSVCDVLKVTASIFENRINSITSSSFMGQMQPQLQTQPLASSGSEIPLSYANYENRVWVRGFVGTAKQNGQEGSEGNHFGFTIGTDVKTEAYDREIIGGVALTHAKLNNKLFNNSKLKSDINMGSIYFNYFFNSSLFANSNVSYGQANIVGLQAQTKSDNKAEIIKVGGNIGYKIPLNNEREIILTPKIGISYDTIKLDTEMAKTPISQKLERITSDFSLALEHIKRLPDSNATLVSGINVGVNYLVKQKSGQVQTQLLDLTQSTQKTQKTIYNIGGSVYLFKGVINIGLEYNFSFQPKYQSHSGATKIELRF